MPPSTDPALDPNAAAQPRFILVNTSHAGNVGAAARAMMVMGFDDLVLVAPRHADVLRHEETLAMASGATAVLARARVVHSFEEALDGVQVLAATAMTPRDFGPPTAAPRPWMAAEAPRGARVGFVFGSERFGLGNDEVYRCHACLSVPTHPGYGSLNLAQAVQLIAYEWRQALGGFGVHDPQTAPPLADARAVQGLLDHWRRALVHIGFLDAAVPRRLLPRLNRLANRARLSEEEVHILRGIARSMLER
jgi:tRNA/rRNA methyltransferase